MISNTIKDIIGPSLWGANPDFLDLETDKFLIIERIMEHGGDKQIKFILTHYRSEDIIHVIRESSYLSPKTVNYWCLYFNLKRENTRCYRKQSLHLWPPS